MPQINRIRVNNVKYNFGTQAYDDFMMKPFCHNTLYDLANGGGKSVLMLLMLQTVLPNCTLDEKQPVEKLFRTGDGSQTIHSLIEWKLDESDIENGYQYMTTGFCAKKAAQEILSDEAIKESAAIEYFNYCIFYREYNENDIRNLPLIKEKERITYSGLKKYLKELERDNSLRVVIFDKKREYQEFISNYGLYESEWEIIRGINKTEGHVRTYFESNYRTTRKVVEDLLIEEIIQKSFTRRLKTEEESMSKTLLAIREKLVELTKQKQTIGNYDKQIDLLNGFSERLGFLKNLYEQREEKEKQLRFLEVCTKDAMKRQEILIQEKENQQKALKEEVTVLVTRAERAKIYECAKKAELFLAQVTEAKKKVDSERQRTDEIKKQRNLLLCMNDYQDYIKDKQGRNEILEAIKAVQQDDRELSFHLGFYTACAKAYIEQRTKLLKAKGETLSVTMEASLEKLSKEEEKEQKISSELAAGNFLITRIKQQKDELLEEIAKLQSEEGILLFDEIPEKIKRCRSQIREVKHRKEQLVQKEEELRGNHSSYQVRLAECEFLLASLGEQVKEKEEFFRVYEKEAKKAEKLLLAYGQKNYDSLLKELDDRSLLAIPERKARGVQAKELKETLSRLERGEFALDTSMLSSMLHSLSASTQEKVCTGVEFLNRMEAEEKAEFYYLYPFLPYAIVIEDASCSMEELIQISQELSKNVVLAVTKSAILKKKAIPGTKDLMILFQDQSLLFDESRLNEEKERISYQLAECEKEAERLKQQIKTYAEDKAYLHVFLTTQEARWETEKKNRAEIDRQQEEARKQKELLEKEDSVLLGLFRETQEQKANAEESLATLLKEEQALLKLSDEVLAYEKLKEQIAEEEKKCEQKALCQEKIIPKVKALRVEIEALKTQIGQIQSERERLSSLWELKYKMYEQGEKYQLPEDITEEIFDKLNAQIGVIEKKHTNLEDKNRLLSTYIQGMNKSLKNIKERGIALSLLEEMNQNQLLVTTEASQLLELGEEQKMAERSLEEALSFYHEQREQYGRWDAAKEQMIAQYEQRFLPYEAELFIDVNIAQFLKETEKAISGKEAVKKELEQELSACFEEKNLLLNLSKDINRYLPQEGPKAMDVCSEVFSGSEIEEKLSYLSKDLVQLNKGWQKKLEEFEGNKSKLIESLKLLDAGGLAMEISENVRAPKSVKEVTSLIKSLSEVNECLVLEKNRIYDGIRDIETIKENFENQCLQRCEHVKTELERLRKLSCITLDQEQVPMIELSIPYIKQDFYQERMSGYIDKIVAEADRIVDLSERLKYIKGALSLKKLFSVIVTDMNAIRLSLYKRERIKEQSRHLRYEEAVGSTGQSQGIYIQFLIAIITYISHINSRKAENDKLSKVIFIDNPFGAAKDIYIWEPIFSLLAQNRVQLIVPARGTTPAITSRFDVNYVLGQKLVNQRQQTVVVDYYSSIDARETEYVPLAYEQTSFDLF